MAGALVSRESPCGFGRCWKIVIRVGKSFGSTARKDSGTSKTWSFSVVFSITWTRPAKVNSGLPSGSVRFSRPAGGCAVISIRRSAAMPGIAFCSAPERAPTASTITSPIRRPFSPATVPVAVAKISSRCGLKRSRKPPAICAKTLFSSSCAVILRPPTISKANESGASSYSRASPRTTTISSGVPPAPSTVERSMKYVLPSPVCTFQRLPG